MIIFNHFKLFKCEKCNVSFAKKGEINRHIAVVHEKKKPFQCNICEKSFPSKSRLNVHASEVHEKKHPFKCIMCDGSFSRKWSLSVHVLKHENNKTLTKGRPRITKRDKDQQNTFNEDLENDQEKSNKNTLGELGDSLQENNLANILTDNLKKAST